MVLNNFCSVQSEDDASKMVIYLLLELNSSSWFCTNGGKRCVLRLWSLRTHRETTTVRTASAIASVHKNIDLSLQIQTGTNNIQHFLTFHRVYIGSGLSLGPNVNSAVHSVMQVK